MPTPEKRITANRALAIFFSFTASFFGLGNIIIAGHARHEACKRLGYKKVPIVRIEHLTEAQKRAYMIADNKLAENAEWHDHLLAEELKFLSDINIELDFDVEITGFSIAEIDQLIDGTTVVDSEADNVPDVPEDYAPRTCRGDVWELGNHRVACVDILDRANFKLLMNGAEADMVFTDPPYTGRGSNYIIIDDAHKPDEVLSEARRKNVLDWYSGTTLSRLDNKKEGVIILVSQRLHEDDLSGHLIAQGNWWHIKLPAIAEETIKYQISANRTFTFNEGDVLHPARESREMLDQLKRDMGSDIFAAQYQQRPNPLGGGMIKSDWFKQYDVLPAKPEQVVMSLDTACKSGELNDYSVCTIWHIHKNAYYLASIWRKRVDYPELKKSVKLLAEEHKPHLILIEDKASGIQLIQELRVETRWSVVDTNPELDKATRMSVHSASIEAGKVFLPKDAEWLDNFMHEILHFPKGKNDDQVDSLSQFLAWAWEHENNDFRHLVWSPASEKGFIPPHMRLL